MTPTVDPSIGFSSPKRALLLLLKRRPDAALSEIAEALGISKVGALRHLNSLESDGLVARSYRKVGVGRPRVCFRLTAPSARLFPEAYSQMSRSALDFIEEKLGRPAVVQLLQQRAEEVAETHGGRLKGLPLGGRVSELVRIRSEGGYMAERGGRSKSTIEFQEHNCPILALADRFPEACEVERRLFERLLKADVSTSHRVVAGDAVCRFLVRPREGA
ncbi:MAG TPA: MarR family transcriptional regulator [Thermoplasmata archaeon]